MRHSSSVNSVANSSGNAAFFDPLTLTSPRNGTPPRTTILSILHCLSAGRCLGNATGAYMPCACEYLTELPALVWPPVSIPNVARMLTQHSNRLLWSLQNLAAKSVIILLLEDGGSQFRQVTADQPKYPCRHCLCKAKPGEQLLLGLSDTEPRLSPRGAM